MNSGVLLICLEVALEAEVFASEVLRASDEVVRASDEVVGMRSLGPRMRSWGS